ncbi:MAG: glycoside hydrolase family 3 N-terminal domain-containing protein [Solirubrobacteraceae bacterium]
MALAFGGGVGCARGAHRSAATAHTTTVPAATGVPSSPAKLLGQRIMVGLSGSRPDAELLSRVREGAVGGVILFSGNIVSRAQVVALTASLQRAARQGRNPPLLIAVDQEGGQVRRFASGPPTLSPPQIAATDSAAIAFRQGRSTGQYLKGRGVNMDLAPVLDVPTFAGAFIWQQGRAFSFSSATVAEYATQFALGLQSAHVAATGKHFPGLGSAGVSTDNQLAELHPTPSQLAGALVPYKALIPDGLDAVMLSIAGFSAYDHSGAPAALSQPIIGGLLRRQLSFGGVTITDSLGAPTGHGETTAGVLAAEAGADIVLYTDSAPGELPALQRALTNGAIKRADARASYRRIVALKRRVASG